MENRCGWASTNELMIAYHDTEWGVPLFDDSRHFEFMTLESAQAGLSWLTILKRREGYRQAFANFDPAVVATFGAQEVEALLKNPSIIRNRAKIEAAIHNAQRFLEVQAEFGTFSSYIWAFVNYNPIINCFTQLADLPAKTPESEMLAKDLKRRGFKFLGPTTIYAHMQAAGLVNDHLTCCNRHQEVQAYAIEMLPKR